MLSEEDFDIKKMTLNAVFSMQLHRFPDEVNELVVTVACQHAPLPQHFKYQRIFETFREVVRDVHVVHVRIVQAQNELKIESELAKDHLWG